MENFEVVLSLAGTALSLLITSIIFVVRLVKAVRKKEICKAVHFFMKRLRR